MAAEFDVEALVAMGRVGAFALSPDGTWVAAAVAAIDEDAAKFVSSIWRVPTDGTAPSLVLEGAFNDTAPGFRSDGVMTLLSTRTDELQGPDDKPDEDATVQLWAVHPDGRLERLSDEPLGVTSYQWARQGSRCVLEAPVWPGVAHEQQSEVEADLKKGPSALRYTSLPVRFWDHWVAEKTAHLIGLLDGQRTDLTPERVERFSEWAWHLSDDGSTLVYGVYGDGVDRLWATGLATVDVGSGVHSHLVGSETLDFSAPHLSPDGLEVVALMTRWIRGGAWNSQLVVIPVATGEVREVAADWDVHATLHGWTADGRSVLTTAAVGTDSPLVAVDVASGQRTTLHEGGTVEAVSAGPGGLAFRVSDLLHPPGLVQVNGQTGESTWLAPLHGLPVDLAEHVLVEEITVESADGAQVQSFVLRPAGPSNGTTLLWIHGGPISQWGNGWQWRWCPALAVCAGYTVALPNPRGSTGFGQAFVQGIWGNVWGEACAQDIHAVADALEQRDDVDAARIVAMGGSFGGYMTNWLGSTTDRFAAIVTHAGLFDFRAFHANSDHPPYWAWLWGLDPWTEGEALERYNPRAHVAGWVSPTMILHGDKDYRVPMSEALALFEALQHRGVDSELVVFPDENHWIAKPRNIVAWYEAWMSFVADRVGSSGIP